MAESPKLSALQQLAASLPAANQKVAQQQQAARDLQLQQAIQKASPAGATTQTAQQTGAAMAQAAGQQQVQQAQQGIQQQTAIGEIGQQQEQQQQQARLAGLQAGAREQEMTNEQKFANISEDAKKEMYDLRRQFAQDEMGRKFTNERQLADYAALRAKSEQDWLNYQQETTQLYERKGQMLQTAHNKITQQLEYENRLINQYQDQLNKKQMSADERAANEKILKEKLALREKLRKIAADAQAAVDREKARKANRQAKYATVGTVIGGIVGLVVSGGNPAGAAVGASAGGAIGSGVAAST